VKAPRARKSVYPQSLFEQQKKSEYQKKSHDNHKIYPGRPGLIEGIAKYHSTILFFEP